MPSICAEDMRTLKQRTVLLLVGGVWFGALSTAVCFAQPDQEDVPPPAIGEQGKADGAAAGRPLRHEMRERFREGRRSRGEGSFRGEGNGPEMRERFGKRNGPMGQGGRAKMGAKLGGYIEAVQNYQKAVQDPRQAIGLAVMGIRDHYRKERKPLEAVKEIDAILQSTQDQAVRNIALFAMRQVYEEERQGDKLLEINKQILKENLSAIQK